MRNKEEVKIIEYSEKDIQLMLDHKRQYEEAVQLMHNTCMVPVKYLGGKFIGIDAFKLHSDFGNK